MPRTRLIPMSAATFADYLEASNVEYANDKVAAGQWSEAEALDKAREESARLLPQGLDTPENWLFDIVADDGPTHDTPVGMVWIARQTRGGKPVAFVYDVLIHPAHQRQGHARRAFQALEQEVALRGMAGIALHVFGHNSAARALYERLGFGVTNLNLFKPLGASDAA
jgi:ribosomal protein S18 acetylase RimI-like enzyme